MVYTNRRAHQSSTIVLCLTGMMSAVLWLASPASAADLTVNPARVQAIASLLAEHPAGVGRPISDRAAWAEVAKRRSFVSVVAAAEQLLQRPLPETSDELYLDYARTGNRTHWETPNFQRRERLTPLVLAECIEHRQRFLPAIDELVRALCAERTWVLPAHDVNLTNYRGERITIDLGSSNLAWMLATADWLLGDELSPDARALIRDRVQARMVVPFQRMLSGAQRADNWITVRGNHNSVTLAGVTGAVLALVESRTERAFFVAAAEQFSQRYLDGFTPDGYCSEGIGYWNYGFGHYLMLSETILQATGGRIDLRARPDVRAPALFASGIELAPGVCPAFADCDITEHPSAHLQAYVARTWGLGARANAPADPELPTGWLFESVLFAFPGAATATQPTSAPWAGPGLRSWFEQGGVLVARPGVDAGDRLAVALKGGHNGEQHNHNDVGAYVAVVGRQPLLVDPGPEVYTARTFSRRRYDSQLLNSYGHPVPVVGGQLQRAGRSARGEVVRTDFTDEVDTLVLDITSAYALPELQQLRRSFVYSRRGRGALTITDTVRFSGAQTFGTALITLGRWRSLAPDRLRVEDGGAAVDITFSAGDAVLNVNAEELHEDATIHRAVTRIGLNLDQPVEACALTLRIEPVAP